MHLQIISGESRTGKTTFLRGVHANLKHQGVEVPIFTCSDWTTPYFLNHLSDQALAGVTHFLADDCTLFQIQGAMALKALGIHSGIPSTFVVHLVRKA